MHLPTLTTKDSYLFREGLGWTGLQDREEFPEFQVSGDQRVFIHYTFLYKYVKYLHLILLLGYYFAKPKGEPAYASSGGRGQKGEPGFDGPQGPQGPSGTPGK
jgi:hypothetical protein